MAFCDVCGSPVPASGQCPKGPHESATVDRNPHLDLTDTPPQELIPAAPHQALSPYGGVGPLPKASTTRRLLGSGIEYLSYIIGIWIITILDVFSAGILGLFSFFLVVLIVLRDFNGGTFSIAKRVSQMRVVDLRTGRAASNGQALLRNGYYLALLLIGALLPWIDIISSFFFTMFIILDVLMIMANRRGRRLGDFLAGTQVVGEAG